MKNYESKTIVEEFCNSITCDVCGREYADIMETQEFVIVDTIGGYSSIFTDGGKIQLDMCQHCFKEKLGEYVRVEE